MAAIYRTYFCQKDGRLRIMNGQILRTLSIKTGGKYT